MLASDKPPLRCLSFSFRSSSLIAQSCHEGECSGSERLVVTVINVTGSLRQNRHCRIRRLRITGSQDNLSAGDEAVWTCPAFLDDFAGLAAKFFDAANTVRHVVQDQAHIQCGLSIGGCLIAGSGSDESLSTSVSCLCRPPSWSLLQQSRYAQQ